MKQNPKKNDKQKLTLIRMVREFFEVTQSKKSVELAFTESKNEFENAMDVLYEKYADEDGNVYVDKSSDEVNGARIKVHKVQQTKVKWDIEKLTKVLGDKKDDVMVNSYDVKDWNLLIKLAKEYHIPWKEFKKCIEITKVVKDDRLDKLIDLGQVDAEKVKNCSEVSFNKPYYKLTEV